MIKYLLTPILFLCFVCDACGQLDEQKAYHTLKKIKGTWVAQQEDKTIYETWQKDDKTSFRWMRYTLQNTDTTLLSKGSMRYQRASILRQAYFIYQIYALDKDWVYPFRLQGVKNESQFEFENYNNQELHKVIYHLIDKKNLTVSHFSKEGTQTFFLKFTKK